MALDLKTGKTLWKSGVGPGGHATPVPFQMSGKTYLASIGLYMAACSGTTWLCRSQMELNPSVGQTSDE